MLDLIRTPGVMELLIVAAVLVYFGFRAFAREWPSREAEIFSQLGGCSGHDNRNGSGVHGACAGRAKRKPGHGEKISQRQESSNTAKHPPNTTTYKSKNPPNKVTNNQFRTGREVGWE